MPPVSPKRLFALDQNFPVPILNAMAQALPMVEMVTVRDVRPELSRVDDWELLLALHQDERPWDGLITNDDSMLALPKEMTVLGQTRLTLVVVKGEGHNPIRATGILLCYVPFICHETRPGEAQVWNLSVRNRRPDTVRDYLDEIAVREKSTAEVLWQQNHVPDADLRPARWKR